MSDEVIAKTIMQFFLDGYDTVASLICIALYFLAVNPDVQDKATAEVDGVASDDLRGDDVNALKYLDQVTVH